jgi:hypothetical protein
MSKSNTLTKSATLYLDIAENFTFTGNIEDDTRALCTLLRDKMLAAYEEFCIDHVEQDPTYIEFGTTIGLYSGFDMYLPLTAKRLETKLEMEIREKKEGQILERRLTLQRKSKAKALQTIQVLAKKHGLPIQLGESQDETDAGNES